MCTFSLTVYRQTVIVARVVRVEIPQVVQNEPHHRQGVDDAPHPVAIQDNSERPTSKTKWALRTKAEVPTPSLSKPCAKHGMTIIARLVKIAQF